MSQAEKKKVGLAVTSLVFGLFFWFPLLGIITSIVAIICGIIALTNIKPDNRYGGKGMAISGIVMGVLGILFIPVLAILASIAIPNFIRARSIANERATIQNLVSLVHSLDMHKSVKKGYPDNWQADMYQSAEPDYGPLSFNVPLDRAAQTVQGFNYQYIPLPAGCSEPNCGEYHITAIPNSMSSGSKSFLVNERGLMYHCEGQAGADSNDARIDEPARPC